MHFTKAKGILLSQNFMNIYRGCTHGCIYCDVRSECYQFKHDIDDVEVKSNAPILLEKALSKKRINVLSRQDICLIHICLVKMNCVLPDNVLK